MTTTTTGVTVGDVARLAGVTVRTLHHYDETGLLRPGARTDAGYRLYTDEDLSRLQQILFYRELGFALDDIRTLLDDPRADAADHLRRQHELLTARIERLAEMRAAVELTLEARQMGIDLTPEEMLEVFGDHDPTEHAEEARERWGDTDAYRESTRRASSYTKEDWQRMKAEVDDIEARFADALAAGVAPDAEAAMDLAEEHRRHIDRWFYPCPYQMHRGLGEMYVADARFAAHYDDRADGLARYVHDAIQANADRAGS